MSASSARTHNKNLLSPLGGILSSLLYTCLIFSIRSEGGIIAIGIMAALIRIGLINRTHQFILSLKIFVVLALFLVFGQVIQVGFQGISINPDGFLKATVALVRIISSYAFWFALFTTHDMTSVAQAVTSVSQPLEKLGVSTQSFNQIVFLTLSTIPLCVQEYHRIAFAQKARGRAFVDTTFKARLTDNLALLIPIILNFFQRAHELSFTLTARGATLDQKESRTERLTRVDTFVIALLIIAIGLVYCFEL